MLYLQKYTNVTSILTTHFVKVCKKLNNVKSIKNCMMDSINESVCDLKSECDLKNELKNDLELKNNLENKLTKTVEQHLNKLRYTYKLKSGISQVKGGISILTEMNYPKEILENTVC